MLCPDKVIYKKESINEIYLLKPKTYTELPMLIQSYLPYMCEQTFAVAEQHTLLFKWLSHSKQPHTAWNDDNGKAN